MSNYTQTTDFSVKDSLASGDSNKIIRGSEFDTEFTNIAAAISSKADLASPTFTGTPAAPTAGSGTNTTQIATTAFVQTAIGSISSGVTSVAAGTDINVTGTGSGPYTGAVTVSAGANLATLSGTQTFSGAKTFSSTSTFSGTSAFSGTATFNNDAIFNPSNINGRNVTVGYASDPSSGYWNIFAEGQSQQPAAVFQGKGSGGQSIFCITGQSATTYIDFSYGSVAGGYSATGQITTNGSTTTYATSSDYRLKENVANLTGAAARVKQLNPVQFTWINNPSVGTVDGFLAHEVQAVVPEAVTGEKDAVNADGSIKAQGIDQSKLVPLLTAALQEAITRIETLEAKVAALEAA
jgi:hypothetical protein